ncbi:RING-H2 finger protein ATL56-like [Hibiscus syriacus]|uniref:RING-H2 finger protein ATL56-like n=1 Tax=Hibiscus syriacus TaxID=106335 RepID=UPI001921DA7E|nr:RING-H2 finger protein ATL56-like [Hibiscus syriacus]
MAPDMIVFVLWALLLVLMVIGSVKFYCRNDLDRDLEAGLTSYSVRDDRAVQASRPSTYGIIVRYRGGEETESSCVECVICLDEFKDGDSCRFLAGCKHLYHQLCVDQWLVQDMHCPLCRRFVYGLELTPTTTSGTDQNQICSSPIST